MDINTTLYTVKEAAKRLTVTESAVRSWLSQGRLKRTRVGRCVRVTEGDIQKFVIESNRHAR